MKWQDDRPIVLVALNITSYCGISLDAEHYYGHLILIRSPRITTKNINNYGSSGEPIKLERPITREMALHLNKKDGEIGICTTHRPGEISDRFNTTEELTDFAIKEYKKLNLDVPFISLYRDRKFKETVIIQPED